MEDLRLDLMDVGIELSGDGEPVWLTPHPRDLIQPEGERDRETERQREREKAFLAGTSSNLSGVVEIDEFTVSRCHIFVSFRNNVGINCTLRQHTVLDSCRHQ